MPSQKSGFALLLTLSLAVNVLAGDRAFAYSDEQHWVKEQNVPNASYKALYGQVRFALGAYDTVASVLGKSPTWLMKAGGSSSWNEFTQSMKTADSNADIKKLELGFGDLAAHFAKWRDDLAAGKGEDVDARIATASLKLEGVKAQIKALKPPALIKPYSEAELNKINQDLDTAFGKLIQKINGAAPKKTSSTQQPESPLGGAFVDTSEAPVSVTGGV